MRNYDNEILLTDKNEDDKLTVNKFLRDLYFDNKKFIHVCIFDGENILALGLVKNLLDLSGDFRFKKVISSQEGNNSIYLKVGA